MTSSDLAAILAELRHITHILYAVGVLTVAAVILACVRTYSLIKRHVDRLDPFSSEADALLEQRQFDKLVDLAAGRIRERPHDAYGYWFMARALYSQGKYAAAIEQFETTRKLRPDWTAGYLDPYIAEARRQMQRQGES